MKTRPNAVAALLLAAVSTLPLVAADADGEARDRARAILNRAAGYYAEMQSMGAVMEIRLEMPEGLAAMAKMVPERYRIALARPARVAVVPDGWGGVTLIQDGERLYAAHAMFRRYLMRDSLPLEQMLQPAQRQTMAVPGLDILLGLALDRDVSGSLLAHSEVELLGPEAVDGVDCHRLGLGSGGSAGEIWIASGEQPWVMRYHSEPPAPTEMPELPDEPDVSGTKPMMIRFEPGVDIRFSEWDSSPDLEGVFAIEPPEDYERADSVFPPMEEMGELLGVLDGEHPSLGKPAPEARLAPLDAEPVDLSGLRGKTVVLDFWATWCVPCVIELPIVEKVTGELAERDVVLYTVNRGESEQTVRRFLAERQLAVPVILDEGDTLSAAFGVQAMPHLVIIDRAGTVRHVHLGSMGGSEQRLRNEISALLAEPTPAGAAAAP